VIDIHSHVLPGLDDGPKTLEESLALLRLASAAGTTDIIATPHANAVFPFDEARVAQAYSAVAAALDVPLRVHLGCEAHLDCKNLRDVVHRPEKYTLNRSRYLLLELPNLVSVPAAEQAVRELLAMQIVPVIAHAERNTAIRTHRSQFAQWKRQGCLVQITAQSLLGGFGSACRRMADELLHEGVVDFVASDTHDCRKRPPDLRPAYDLVGKSYGAAAAERLFVENPAAVLTNGALPSSPARRRSAFGFLCSGMGMRGR
jgi:protein-tyrosine phosphatase